MAMSRGIDSRSRLASRGATVRDVIALFRRRWWVVAACVVLIPAAVYAYSAQLPRTYEATVVVQPDRRRPPPEATTTTRQRALSSGPCRGMPDWARSPVRPDASCITG